jgi:hypothetical protein
VGRRLIRGQIQEADFCSWRKQEVSKRLDSDILKMREYGRCCKKREVKGSGCSWKGRKLNKKIDCVRKIRLKKMQPLG